MYKLMVVAGPTRGATYAVEKEGETSIGRQSGNNVVLQSVRVSKRHCVLVASNGELLVKDQGSSNGTFINGVLAKERKLKSGDRISVGEFVFEVVESKPAHQSAGLQRLQKLGDTGNIIRFPSGDTASGAGLGQMSANGAVLGGLDGMQNVVSAPAEPKTPKEKAIWAFEHFVMPFFYGLGMKNEWRLVCAGVFAAFCVANMFISIAPLLESSRKSIVRESGRRATFMARQLAEINAPLIASHAENRVDMGAVENADGVRIATITDLENRVIAPVAKQNQYLTSGSEALIATKARDLFRSGRETGVTAEADSDTIIAIEPLKVYNQATGKNIVIGMAIVSIDTSIATLGFGDIGLVYSETMILTALLGALALFILYRLTLKPLQVLNEDMDKALKGDISQVTHEFKVEELNPLWDLVNSALQRIPKSGSFGGSSGKNETPISAEDCATPIRALSGFGKMGVVICDGDRKIVSLNSLFEEISGIRSEASVGQDIPAVARDQAFAAFVNDLFDRVHPGGEGVGDDFDFSGVTYKVNALAIGSQGTVKCYILVAHRNGSTGD
jgi:hypothetical protein